MVNEDINIDNHDDDTDTSHQNPKNLHYKQNTDCSLDMYMHKYQVIIVN